MKILMKLVGSGFWVCGLGAFMGIAAASGSLNGAPSAGAERREPLQNVWIRPPLVGVNLRPFMASAEQREGEGGGLIASRLATFCAQAKGNVRLAIDGNDGDGRVQRQILERARASCSQILSDEARPGDLLQRLMNPALKDPYVIAFKRVVDSGEVPDPRVRVTAVMDAANSGVYEALGFLALGTGVSFEGKSYKSAAPSDFDQTSSTLLAYAANVAACDFGADCSVTGLEFASNCISHKVMCRAKDVREQYVLLAQDLAGQPTSSELRQKILDLSERLSKAVKSRTDAAFLPVREH